MIISVSGFNTDVLPGITDTGRSLGPYRQEISLGRNINRGMMVYRRMHPPHDSKNNWSGGGKLGRILVIVSL